MHMRVRACVHVCVTLVYRVECKKTHTSGNLERQLDDKLALKGFSKGVYALSEIFYSYLHSFLIASNKNNIMIKTLRPLPIISPLTITITIMTMISFD